MSSGLPPINFPRELISANTEVPPGLREQQQPTLDSRVQVCFRDLLENLIAYSSDFYSGYSVDESEMKMIAYFTERNFQLANFEETESIKDCRFYKNYGSSKTVSIPDSSMRVRFGEMQSQLEDIQGQLIDKGLILQRYIKETSWRERQIDFCKGYINNYNLNNFRKKDINNIDSYYDTIQNFQEYITNSAIRIAPVEQQYSKLLCEKTRLENEVAVLNNNYYPAKTDLVNSLEVRFKNVLGQIKKNEFLISNYSRNLSAQKGSIADLRGRLKDPRSQRGVLSSIRFQRNFEEKLDRAIGIKKKMQYEQNRIGYENTMLWEELGELKQKLNILKNQT